MIPDHEQLPTPWYRSLSLPVLATTAAGLAGFALGAPLPRAVVIALTAGVVMFFVVRCLDATPPSWPEPERPLAQAISGSLGWPVEALARSRDMPGTLERRLRGRLRELARRVADRRGAASITAPLGAMAPAAENLFDEWSEVVPGPRTVSAVIEAITAAAVDPAAGVTPLAVPPSLRPTAGRRSRFAIIRSRPPLAGQPRATGAPALIRSRSRSRDRSRSRSRE